jgi:hypothetical protein
VTAASPSWPLDCRLDVDDRYVELSDRRAQEVPLKPDGEDSHGHDQEDFATDDACDERALFLTRLPQRKLGLIAGLLHLSRYWLVAH